MTAIAKNDLSRACNGETPSGLTRHARRLREIALQGMMSVTAEQRAQRAFASRQTLCTIGRVSSW
eukprot:9882253-Prorocentrum_lima.AAC.1